MNSTTRIKRGLAAAVLAAGLAAGPVHATDIPESGDAIKLAVNEWTGQHISTHVAGELLKKRMEG